MTGENMRNFIKIVEENSKRQLDELFKDKPYDVRFHEGPSGPVARFMSKTCEYEIIFSQEEEGEYTVTFRQVGSNDDKQYDVTGTGDQFQVINTVTNTVLNFIKNNHPEYIGFTGSKKDGHSKLYGAIVKLLNKDLTSLGYSIDRDDQGPDQVAWSFIKGGNDEDEDDDMYENKTPDMRKIMQITEAGLLPDAPMMIRIDPDVYKLMRALLFIANPEAYENNNKHDDAGMMVFNDKITYETTVKRLKEFGIPFKDDSTDDVETIDKELMPSTDNNVSPYPNNQNSKKPSVKKKKIVPNPYKDGR